MKLRLLLLAGLTLVMSAQATLVSNSTGLTDTTTKLDWLRLTETQNVSVDAVNAGYGGFLTNGWRYALETEVMQLFATAGAANPTGYSGPQLGDYGPAKLLVSLLGYTVDGSNASGVTLAGLGFTGTGPQLGAFYVAQYQLNEYFSDPTKNSGSFIPIQGSQFGTANQDIGSFLVRQVPESNTLALFVLGLVGLGYSHRKL